MPNTVLIPVSAALYFDREAPFSTRVSPLSVAARIAYDNIGGLTVTSYVTGASAIERFRVEGTQGSLFSVTDVLTGVLFSVNDISGLPILTVQDTDTIIGGAFNTNTLVVSGTRVGIGVNIGTTKVTVSGSLSASGTIFASGGNSDQWNNTSSTMQLYSGFWQPDPNVIIQTDIPYNFLSAYINDVTFLVKGDSFPFNLYSRNTSDSTFVANTSGFSGLYIESGFSPFNSNFGALVLFEILTEMLPVSVLETSPTPKEFVLPNLMGCGQTLQISFPTLTAIRLPELLYSQAITVNNVPRLSVFSAPKLKMVGIFGGYAGGGGMNFQNVNQNMLEYDFPELIYSANIAIGGYSSKTTSIPLRRVSHPKLRGLGTYFIGGNTSFTSDYPLLTSLEFPLLEQATSISVISLSGLSALEFPRLHSISSLQLIRNTNLKHVYLDSLRFCIGGYFIRESSFNPAFACTALTAISAPKLEIFGSPGTFAFSPIIGNTTYFPRLSVLDIGTNTLRAYIFPSFECSTILTRQSMDNVLAAFNRLDGTNNTKYMTGRTITLAGNNAAPSYAGGTTTASAGGNFNRVGSLVTVNSVGHGHTTGNIVTFTGNTQSALNGTYVVTVNTPDQFQYTTATSGNIAGGGTVTMRKTSIATEGFRYYQNLVLRGNTVTINLP